MGIDHDVAFVDLLGDSPVIVEDVGQLPAEMHLRRAGHRWIVGVRRPGEHDERSAGFEAGEVDANRHARQGGQFARRAPQASMRIFSASRLAAIFLNGLWAVSSKTMSASRIAWSSETSGKLAWLET